MEDNIVIKTHRYTNFNSQLKEDIQSYLNPGVSLYLTKTGVTIDDDEMITLSAFNRTYVSFRVDPNGFVKKVTIASDTFSGPFSIIQRKYQIPITEYFNSYLGTKFVL